MDRILAACGNDCSACPRYTAHPYENDTAIISANKEGLLSLSNHLKSLAEEPFGSHIHLDAYNSLENDSAELILEKI